MKKKVTLTYRFVRFWVDLFFGRIDVEGQLPSEPAILVSNHCQMNGPLAAELRIPDNSRIWCAGEMMHWREIPAYAYKDFWSYKPKWSRWFYKGLSYAIVPLASCVFNNARTIAVYHDNRALGAFKETVQALQEGDHVVIFPECDEPGNHIVMGFQKSFVDVARLYWRRTGKRLSFVPMYLAPRLKKWVVGQPVVYDPEAPREQERERILKALHEAVTALALAQPEHTVIPYRKLPGVPYPKNK